MPFKIVKALFESRDYVLVSTSSDYKNSNTKLKYICKTHGIKYITYGNLHSGYGCPKCATDKTIGSGNPKWQGGITQLNHCLRQAISPWVQQQMQRVNYQCELSHTRGQGKLNVHHMYPFKRIVQLTMDELNLPIMPVLADYSKHDLQVIISKFIVNNDIYANPIVLLDSVHYEFHKFCGGTSEDTSMEQLEAFKQQYYPSAS